MGVCAASIVSPITLGRVDFDCNQISITVILKQLENSNFPSTLWKPQKKVSCYYPVLPIFQNLEDTLEVQPVTIFFDVGEPTRCISMFFPSGLVTIIHLTCRGIMCWKWWCLLLMVQKSCTSWYGKIHFLEGFIHPRWLFGIVETLGASVFSTTWRIRWNL